MTCAGGRAMWRLLAQHTKMICRTDGRKCRLSGAEAGRCWADQGRQLATARHKTSSSRVQLLPFLLYRALVRKIEPILPEAIVPQSGVRDTFPNSLSLASGL